MLSKIIDFSLKSKLLVLLFVFAIISIGLYSLNHINIGAVPDITNNQVQVLTTSKNLSTTDIEQFITYPIELEMSNLPGVKEIRSVSKFGLSVVTIVFEDNMGTYLPRQLIAEKLKVAEQKIPSHFGKPSMGPISTGLGEIYQYTIEVEEEHKDKYSLMQLRSIQDWIIKRQLAGIHGVVEINTWGGYLKQYEVAFSTEKLQAYNISISQLMKALQNNNAISGGSYIEKNNQAYFIRGDGLINSLKDIKQIVVDNKEGTPIYVENIASVNYGFAPRFGAITANGEGEKVLGQIMMLKNANSNQTINNIKKRLKKIEKSLPEGVYINGFLDRSELISRTTTTIFENLLLGFVVVILIVILLIGDWRSGLIIASVIPLSFLTAISLMYFFGLDANLMSLGALDFGIIIDGAVIIVEFVAFKMMKNSKQINALKPSESKALIHQLTLSGTTKMINSAIFGQLIILIVFIPILTLQGVEGKMFTPMALTFCFALIGAIMVCFTWIPVACSWFLKPTKSKGISLSNRILNFLYRLYHPCLLWSLNHSKSILFLFTLLLGLTTFTFSKIGGEFIPTLDEEDFVIQPVLKTGKSLTSTIQRTTQIEKILLDEFSEVEQVISRIGAAEVPTDPMSMQDSDVIIKLKPKSKWVSADSKQELAELIKQKLSIFPNMEVEFTQPIEMRFNELITGVKSDIAIKVFGENLDILSNLANQIKELLKNLDGVGDISVEKITGLPQMRIQFDREKIARYGMNIQQISEVTSTGFAGQKLGVVFEGEKRYDLVARLKAVKRQDITNLQYLMLDTPNGSKIPLTEVAKISYEEGPAKISRDQTQRRIVVGINVRNRDLQSVVEDAQDLINDNIKTPTGYGIVFGGQFENLQSASKRLQIVVPIALLLIFMMLYLALKTLKDTLLIFTAIPFSAIGGVYLLWFRDMPFSISAGVGFIALFGISVLNGIILVERLKEIQLKTKILDITSIQKATKERFRAVLLTASSTALGFLPMAMSSGTGAEVQRPLATVVIGGLITSTILTLFILPVLYYLLQKPKKNTIIKSNVLMWSLIFSMGSILSAHSQDLNGLKNIMLKNNKGLKASQLKIQQQIEAQNQAFQFDKMQFYQNYDESELDPIANRPFYQWGLVQKFYFPSVYTKKLERNKAKTSISKNQNEINIQRGLQNLEIAYQKHIIIAEKIKIYTYLDSLYQDFYRMADLKFEEGESTYLEKITAQSKQNQVHSRLMTLKNELSSNKQFIQGLIQSEEILQIEIHQPERIQLVLQDLQQNTILSLGQSIIDWKDKEWRLSKNQLLPDISISSFLRSNPSVNQYFYGYQVGIHIPILFFGDKAKIKTSKIQKEIAILEYEQLKSELSNKQNILIQTIQNQKENLDNYEKHQIQVANEIIKTAQSAYKNGEISFYQYIQSLDNAMQIKIDFLNILMDYNLTVLQLNYLILN